jgi:hypothetical protein
MSPRTLALKRWSNRPLFAAMHESEFGPTQTSSNLSPRVSCSG